MHRRGRSRSAAATDRRSRQRLTARIVGGTAALAMVVVGCTTLTGGAPRSDAEEAPVYRASVSASMEASAASSSARESSRQQSAIRQAVRRSCDALSTSSVDAIWAVNSYVDAFNTTADIAPKVGPAVDALNRSAELVSVSLDEALSAELRDALQAWIDAARLVATAIAEDYPTDEFNDGVTQLNDARSRALELCDASY